jgi:hypothetical protein
VHQLLQAELCAEQIMVLHLVDVQQALVVLTGKTFLVIQATGFVALQEVYPNPPVVVA